MHNLDTLKAAQRETRRLLSLLRQCDDVTTPDAYLAVIQAQEHIGYALNTLRVAAKRENNRLLDVCDKMGV
jgi:hypothetical protein